MTHINKKLNAKAKVKKALLTMSRVLMLIIGVTAIGGCGFFGGNSPSKVVQRAYKVIENGDYKAYEKVMTTETAQEIAAWGEKARGMLIAKGGVVAMEETIDGNRSEVIVTFKSGYKETEHLVIHEGKWKLATKHEWQKAKTASQKEKESVSEKIKKLIERKILSLIK